MTEYIRTPDENFSDLDDFPFVPNYHEWQDLRQHYVDEGPIDAPVMLMLHGMPTWSYMYREMIPLLVDAGYRCIAVDHMGFGRSDKPTDIHWYTIARHTEILNSLIVELDLKNVTIFCQDWGGPTGLAQAAMMPDRFEHLVIMNTWLHHPGYEYSEGIHQWNANWHGDGMYVRSCPDVGLLPVVSAGLIEAQEFIPALLEGKPIDFSPEAAAMYRGFSAPYRGLPDEAFNGYRRFPLSIPLDSYHNGNAAAQTMHYEALLKWQKGCQFIWGTRDNVFTEAWGREWAQRMGNARFDAIEESHHFPQNSHGPRIVELVLDEKSKR